MLICPFYAVMFVDYGLSGLEVSLLFAVWSWSGTCIALEVPSGALADRFSRKRATFRGPRLRSPPPGFGPGIHGLDGSTAYSPRPLKDVIQWQKPVKGPDYPTMVCPK